MASGQSLDVAFISVRGYPNLCGSGRCCEAPQSRVTWQSTLCYQSCQESNESIRVTVTRSLVSLTSGQSLRYILSVPYYLQGVFEQTSIIKPTECRVSRFSLMCLREADPP